MCRPFSLHAPLWPLSPSPCRTYATMTPWCTGRGRGSNHFKWSFTVNEVKELVDLDIIVLSDICWASEPRRRSCGAALHRPQPWRGGLLALEADVNGGEGRRTLSMPPKNDWWDALFKEQGAATLGKYQTTRVPTYRRNITPMSGGGSRQCPTAWWTPSLPPSHRDGGHAVPLEGLAHFGEHTADRFGVIPPSCRPEWHTEPHSVDAVVGGGGQHPEPLPWRGLG